NADYDKGDFVFKVLGSPLTPKNDDVVPLSDARINVEVTFWNSVKDSKDPGDLEDYLETYPNGQFVSLARRRLAQLKSGTRAATAAPPVSTSPYLKTQFTTGQIIGGVFQQATKDCEVYLEDLGNGVKLEMVRIPDGKFMMGSPAGEQGRDNDEGPQREVNVRGFLMGRYEVTQQIWRQVAMLPKIKVALNPEPSNFKGNGLPVEQVSWDEVKEFIGRLNRKLGLTEKDGYRLPSEAEWEYAARAGTNTPFAFGETIDAKYVNYNGNYPYGSGLKGEYRQRTMEVGKLGVANGWGLFDMHGNVWEWCEDGWHDSYQGAPSDGSAGNNSVRAAYRVVRGGGWGNIAVYCRSASRYGNAPG
ncbi:MAG: formylglycine-generating enzyme family protein, partial [Acidobacteriota bacterium]